MSTLSPAELVERLRQLGIEGGYHAGATGRGRIWMHVGCDYDVDGNRIELTGRNVESDGSHTAGNRWCWRIGDAERLLDLIESTLAAHPAPVAGPAPAAATSAPSTHRSPPTRRQESLL